MSVVDSNSAPAGAVIRDAARGVLPAWACMTQARREHAARVATLLREWAAALDLADADRGRWAAAGWLHDALKDETAERLRAEVAPSDRDLPDALLHGPAVAGRLAGSADAELRDAIRFHTLGHPSLRELGRALYLADFLEPGRTLRAEWRAELRMRMPQERAAVLREVVRARIVHLLGQERPVRSETIAFWNRIADEEAR